jgi:hypothetical protein
MFFSPEGADKQEWRSIVYSYRPIPLIYRMSSWGFSGVGALILTFTKAMSKCDSGMWWRTVGSGLCLQGILSYMADVYTWGRRDRFARVWKNLDALFAAVMTSFCGPVVCYRMLLGLFVLDADLLTMWNICVVLALASKVMGARAARKNNISCEHLLLWHCGWHGLPWMGMVLVTSIVLRARSEAAMEIASDL